MKSMVTPIVLLAVLLTSGASAQMVILDLSGRYRCVQFCAAGEPGQFAYIRQNGTELNLLDDAGRPWRGYVERPGRIWVHRLDQSAIYSADGITIQFEGGTVWQRDLGTAVPVPAPGRRSVPTPIAPVARATVFDGSWNVTILTRSGPCDPRYDFGARIVGGNVVYAAGPVELQGQVEPNGAIWVRVAGGGGRADGGGRLTPRSGGGTWQGEGPLGACAGTWQAVRAG